MRERSYPQSQSNLTQASRITRCLEEDNFADKYPDLNSHWKNLRTRALIYANSTNYPGFTKSWFLNKDINRRLREILSGIDALRELERNTVLTITQKKSIEQDIRLALDAEFSYLTMMQNLKIMEDQNIYRPEILVMERSLKAKAAHIHTLIKDKKIHKQLSKSNDPALYHFYKRFKRINFSFNLYIARTDRGKDVVSVISGVSNVTQAGVEGLGVMGILLGGIPALGALFAATGLVLSAVRSWWEKRKTRDKVLDTGIAIGVIGLITVAGLVPVTTAIISAALVTAGVIKEYILPAIQLFRKIHQTENELKLSQEKITNLNSNFSVDKKLDSQDKNNMLRILESQCIKNQTVSLTDILKIRKLLENPDVNGTQLLAEPIVRSVFNVNNADQVKGLLIKAENQRTDTFKMELESLKKNRAKQVSLASNSLLTIAGVILCCIPTPPTLAVGASLILVSSVVNLVVKYDLIQRAASKVMSLFGESKTVENNVTNKEPKAPRPVMRNLYTFIGSNKSEPKPVATYPTGPSRELFHKEKKQPTNDRLFPEEDHRKKLN